MYICGDLLHLPKNTFNRKRISANLIPNLNSNPKAQLCFRTDEMTSFFEKVYRYLSLCRLPNDKIYLFCFLLFVLFYGEKVEFS